MWLSQWWRRHKRWPVVAGGSFQSRRGLCCSCGNRRRGLAWECGCIVGAKGKLTVVTRVVLGGWMACNGGERESSTGLFLERETSYWNWEREIADEEDEDDPVLSCDSSCFYLLKISLNPQHFPLFFLVFFLFPPFFFLVVIHGGFL